MAMFDRFVFVDWSASSTPKVGENSIWIGSCFRGDTKTLNTVNPSTRKEALSCLKEIDRVGNRKGKKIQSPSVPTLSLRDLSPILRLDANASCQARSESRP